MTRTITFTAALLATILITLSACAGSATRPAASEFGTGPRTSARGLYVATLHGAAALKPR